MFVKWLFSQWAAAIIFSYFFDEEPKIRFNREYVHIWWNNLSSLHTNLKVKCFIPALPAATIRTEKKQGLLFFLIFFLWLPKSSIFLLDCPILKSHYRLSQCCYVQPIAILFGATSAAQITHFTFMLQSFQWESKLCTQNCEAHLTCFQPTSTLSVCSHLNCTYTKTQSCFNKI